MDNGANFLATPIIRRYSAEREEQDPGDVLTMALAVAVKNEKTAEDQSETRSRDWLKWLRDLGKPKATIEERLEQYTQEIIEVWGDLRIQNAGKDSGKSSLQRVPQIQDVYDAVDLARTNWDNKKLEGFHTISHRFCSFAKTMESYSYLFKVIPTGDKYVSLITGVVSSVIKVSANYEKAAEAFSSGLEDLHKSMSAVSKEPHIADTARMQEFVIQLYVEVFKFLCFAMKWFLKRSSRFWKSFDSKYVDNINQSITRISDIVEDIRQEGAQMARIEMKAVRSDVGDVKAQLTEITDRFTTMDERLQMIETISRQGQLNPSEVKNLLEAVILGLQTGRLLGANMQQSSYDMSLMVRPEPEGNHRVDDVYASSGRATLETIAPITESVPDVASRTTYLKADIEKTTIFLRPYGQDGRETALHSQRSSAQSGLPEESLVGLSTWIKAQETKFIWVEGPPGLGNSNLSATAMQLCDILLGTNLPCISFFGTRRSTVGEKGTQNALIAFLYSIVLQLVQLLPKKVVTSTDLSSTRFAQLNGTFATAELALDIITDLNHEVQIGILHWILDGVNLIEDRDTRPYIAKLIEILREQGEQTVCKVCFTTNGNCYILNQSTKSSEKVDASRTFRPGEALIGGIDVMRLGSYI